MCVCVDMKSLPPLCSLEQEKQKVLKFSGRVDVELLSRSPVRLVSVSFREEISTRGTL